MKNSLINIVASTFLLGAGSCLALAQSNTVPNDNTKMNKMDSSNMGATADAQKNDGNDLSITQRIRKSVIADKSLSTYAHNIKIVSVNGTVTLNGVVRSDQEKSSVESKAVAVVGQSRVVDDLKVQPPKS